MESPRRWLPLLVFLVVGVRAWQCSDCLHSPPQCVVDNCGFGTCACNDHGIISEITGGCLCDADFSGLECETFLNPVSGAVCGASNFGPSAAPGAYVDPGYFCSGTNDPTCANGTSFSTTTTTPAAHLLSLPDSPCVAGPASLTTMKIGSSTYVTRETAGNRYFLLNPTANNSAISAASVLGGDWFLVQPILSGTEGARDILLLNPSFHFLYLGVDLSNTSSTSIVLLSTAQNGPAQPWRLSAAPGSLWNLENVAMPGSFLSVSSTQQQLVLTNNQSLASSVSLSLTSGSSTCSVYYYFPDCLPPRRGPYYLSGEASAAAGAAALLGAQGIGETPLFSVTGIDNIYPRMWDFFQIDASNEVILTSHVEQVILDSVLTVDPGPSPVYLSPEVDDTLQFNVLQAVYEREATATFMVLPVNCATGALLSASAKASSQWSQQCFVLQLWRTPFLNPDSLTVARFLTPGGDGDPLILTSVSTLSPNVLLPLAWRAFRYPQSYATPTQWQYLGAAAGLTPYLFASHLRDQEECYTACRLNNLCGFVETYLDAQELGVACYGAELEQGFPSPSALAGSNGTYLVPSINGPAGFAASTLFGSNPTGSRCTQDIAQYTFLGSVASVYPGNLVTTHPCAARQMGPVRLTFLPTGQTLRLSDFSGMNMGVMQGDFDWADYYVFGQSAPWEDPTVYTWWSSTNPMIFVDSSNSDSYTTSGLRYRNVSWTQYPADQPTAWRVHDLSGGNLTQVLLEDASLSGWFLTVLPAATVAIVPILEVESLSSLFWSLSLSTSLVTGVMKAAVSGSAYHPTQATPAYVFNIQNYFECATQCGIDTNCRSMIVRTTPTAYNCSIYTASGVPVVRYDATGASPPVWTWTARGSGAPFNGSLIPYSQPTPVVFGFENVYLIDSSAIPPYDAGPYDLFRLNENQYLVFNHPLAEGYGYYTSAYDNIDEIPPRSIPTGTPLPLPAVTILETLYQINFVGVLTPAFGTQPYFIIELGLNTTNLSSPLQANTVEFDGTRGALTGSPAYGLALQPLSTKSTWLIDDGSPSIRDPAAYYRPTLQTSYTLMYFEPMGLLNSTVVPTLWECYEVCTHNPWCTVIHWNEQSRLCEAVGFFQALSSSHSAYDVVQFRDCPRSQISAITGTAAGNTWTGVPYPTDLDWAGAYIHFGSSSTGWYFQFGGLEPSDTLLCITPGGVFSYLGDPSQSSNPCTLYLYVNAVYYYSYAKKEVLLRLSVGSNQPNYIFWWLCFNPSPSNSFPVAYQSGWYLRPPSNYYEPDCGFVVVPG